MCKKLHLVKKVSLSFMTPKYQCMKNMVLKDKLKQALEELFQVPKEPIW